MTVMNKNNSEYSFLKRTCSADIIETSPEPQGTVIFKKGLIHEKTKRHYIIELMQPPRVNCLDILAYNVEDFEENDFLQLEGVKGRLILDSFDYDVNQLADAVKLVPVERGIKIILNKNLKARPRRRNISSDLNSSL